MCDSRRSHSWTGFIKLTLFVEYSVALHALYLDIGNLYTMPVWTIYATKEQKLAR